MENGSNSNAAKESDIAEYRISTAKVDGGDWVSKNVFFNTLYFSSNSYCSYNPKNQNSQKCEVKTSVNGERFLQTLPSDTIEDNLLSLDKFTRNKK